MNLKEIVMDGRINKARKYVAYLSFYILPLLLLTWLSYGYFVDIPMLYYAGYVTGEAALYLLIFIMFIQPLSVFFPKIKLFRALVFWRKELGVLMFYTAVVHSVGYWVTFSLSVSDALDLTNNVTYGAFAMLLMLPMFITSNNWSVKKIKHWKTLQRVGYLAYIATLVHVGMLHDGFLYYGIAALYLITKGVEFWMTSRKG